MFGLNTAEIVTLLLIGILLFASRLGQSGYEPANSRRFRQVMSVLIVVVVILYAVYVFG